MSDIRALEAADASMIFDLMSRAHAVAEVPIGPHWDRAQVEAECHQGGWVSVDASGQVEAFILYRDLGAAQEVTFLATHPDLRQKGVMSRLVIHLIKSRLPGIELWLEVHEKNISARRLYEKCGFRQVGARPRYYSDGGSACLYNYG